jgi:serine/threonine protein kinase/formylglycine-generating enzyme required for sulfatase activity
MAENRLPEKIGRFSVQRRLGVGSFGEVFLAHDDELDRPVALKLPRLDRIAEQASLEDFLAEARSAARLKHPGIISVHDVSTGMDGIFIVLEYVEGCDLAEVMRGQKLTPMRVAEVMIEIADAVSYAHEQGLIHRDLKPANVLLDSQGHAHVADFGLAIRQKGQRFLRGQIAGTRSYMSPEQVRGETHRLDGRTDIWSLGVMLYEMLTGERPFSGETTAELFDEIQHREVRPLRQIDRKCPGALERICLKCLSKRMTERYTTADDLVDEMRHWHQTRLSAQSTALAGRTGTAFDDARVGAHQASGSDSSKPLINVIPKGLRSFDADDADFFLGLLPGPFDRDGLPESIRFWKTRIEETDSDKTFAVGLVYGPSGCGRSSLVKAGLLPRLAEHVRAVYIEASAGATEARLIQALRKACSDLPEDASLADLIVSIREGQLLPPGQKIIVILDQFEQWLHTWQADPESELVRALRHCDGQSVQCLLLVRSGFGMSAMRFMQTLEIPVIEGSNYATVDRFNLQHARKVLADFGRAFGRLAEDGSHTPEQAQFLEQAVQGLAQEGHVVSVRLALFADMFRDKPWDISSLRKVGGAEGIGVAFLEETLGASATNPTYRLHQQAARRVLHALLPERGTNIRRHVLAHHELQEISGYANSPRDFAALLRILDSELRLITPSDPQETGEAEESPSARSANHSTGRGYQLTHDYMVPALRDWLGRKRRETMRGRASLLLEGQAELWNVRPERRYLPSLLESATIFCLTRRSQWTDLERKMMGMATRLHSVRISLIAALSVVLLVTGFAIQTRVAEERTELVDSLTEELLVAKMDRVPEILDNLEPYRESWHARLQDIADDPSGSAQRRTRAHLALARHDETRVPYLFERLLASRAEDSEYRVLMGVLSDYPRQVAAAARRELAGSIPNGSEADVERLAERRANAVVSLVWLGDAKLLWPLLESSQDQRLRTLLIHRMHRCGIDGKTLWNRLLKEKDPSIRQALLLALEAYRQDGLASETREQLQQQCWSLYRSEPDPGVHAAAEWLLRSWGHEDALSRACEQLAQSRSESKDTLRDILVRLDQGSPAEWYIDSYGHTMIVLRMPSAGAATQESEARPASHVTVARTLALSAHEVTIQQYRAIFPDAEYVGRVSPSMQCPMNGVNWYDAVRYCRRLSNQEQLAKEQKCYPPEDQNGRGMKVPDDFLSRTGYRLPTREEWEFACRAGTTTSRFYGETDQMLPHYAWFIRNSQERLWPVGSLKPNPLGFFDVYGNVSEWSHERYAAPSAHGGTFAADAAGQLGSSIWPGTLHGGAYNRPAEKATSHNQEPFELTNQTSFVGFRIARTIRD